MYGSKASQLINLIPLSTTSHSLESVKSFAEHIREIHTYVKREIALSNKTYKIQAYAHYKFKEYKIWDYVFVHICLEYFSKTPSKDFMYAPLVHFKLWEKLTVMHMLLTCLLILISV